MASFAEDMKKRKQLKNKLSSGDYSHPSGADPTDTFTQSVAETMPPAIKESSTVKKVQSTPSKVSPKKSSSSSSKKKSSSSSSVKETTVVSDSGDDSIFGKTSLWDEHNDEKSAFAKAANEALKRQDTTKVYLDHPDHRNGEPVNPLSSYQKSRARRSMERAAARKNQRLSGMFSPEDLDALKKGEDTAAQRANKGSRTNSQIIADADTEMKSNADFYNDFQDRKSRNPLYNPWLAQQVGGTKINPLETVDQTGMTLSQKSAYMYDEIPEYAPGMTEEAKAYVDEGKKQTEATGGPKIKVKTSDVFGYPTTWEGWANEDANYKEVDARTYMTDEQRNKYYYLQGRYGKSAADEYLKEITPQLELAARQNNRNTQYWQETAEETPFKAAFASLPLFVSSLIGNEEAYDYRDVISQTLAQDESGARSLFTTAAQGLAENAIPMGLSFIPKVGIVASAALSGYDTGRMTYERYKRAGMEIETPEVLNIAAQSVIAAASWGFMSKAINSPVKAVTSKTSKKALTTLAANVAGGTLAGAGVGATQSALVNIADSVIMGDESQYNQLKEQYVAQGMSEDTAAKQAFFDIVSGVVTAAAVGGVTGATMSLPGAIAEGISYRSRGRTIREEGGAAQTVDDGMTFAEDSDAYKNAVKLNSKLQRGLEVTDDEIGAQDILNRTEAAKQAAYINKYEQATGQKVEFGETPEGVNAYNEKGRIVVSQDIDDDLASVVRHEGAHGAENAESYSEYRSLVRQAENYDAIADRVRRTYDDLGMKYDDSVVESEVAADFARNFLKDTKDLSRLQRAAQNNTSLIDRAYNGIRTLEAKVKALGGREFQDPVTGLRVSYDDLNTMRRAFENALLEARETGYNDGSLMYSVKRNYDAAKYGVAIDSELTRLINELGINRRIFTAQDKSQIKEIIRSAYKAFDEGDTVTGARLLREAGDILRTKDPKKYSGEDIAKDFEDQFTELYYNGKSQNSAKQQRQQTQQDMKDYNVSAAGLVQRYERQNGIYLDKTERTAYSAAVRSAFNMLKNGDREGARAELRPVADSMVREARVENPGFTENERQLISRLDTLKLDYSELRNSPDENMRELYDRLRTITGSSTKGKRIDQVYGELESEFGKAYFDTSRETNPVDQLSRIAEVYDEIKNNETLPMYRDRDYDAAAEAMVDDMIHQYDRAQPADDSVTPPERIRSDMERYGIDIETPFRNMGMTGITEGNIEDLSNMVRRQLDATMRAIDEDMGAGAGDTAVRLYDDFAANFNERFGEIAGTMNVSDENKSAAAQLVYESVVTPMDAIVNSYLVTENDIISAAALGIEKADGTKVTPAELEFAKKRADRLTKTQQKIRGMKLSNYYTNSGQKPFFTPETRKVMDARKDEFYYEGITNKGTYERAKKNIAREGIDKTMSALMSKKKWTAFDNAEALALIAHFQENGDHQRAVDIFSVQRRHLTEAGQFVQSAKLISKLSPDGRFIDSMRQMDNYVDEQIERSGNPAQIRQKLKRAEETDRQRDAGKRDQYNSMLRDQTKAMQDLNDIESKLKDAGEERDAAQTRLDDKNNEYDKALKDERELSKTRGELESELEKSREQYDKLRDREIEAGEKLGSLEDEVKTAQKKVNGAKLRLSDVRKRIRESKSRIKSYDGRTKALEAQAEEIETELKTYEKELDQKRKTYNRAKEGYEKLRDMRKSARDELKSLEGRTETLIKRADKASDDISRIRKEIEAAKKEYDEADRAYSELTKSRSDTRQTLLRIVRNKNRIVDEYTKAGKKLNSAVDEVLNSEGIKHIPEHIRSYISAAFNWIEYIDNIDDFIDLIIIPTSKMRKTSAGKSIKKSLKKAAKDGGVEMMKGIAINQLYGLVQDYMPKSKLAKLSTVQVSAMLINSTTFIRNILSNAFFSPFETATNYVAIIPDMVMSLWTKNRSVAMENPFIGWTSAAKRARLSRIEQALNVEGLTDDANPYISKRRTTTSRAGTWMERWLGYSLSVPDEWQKGYVEEQVRRSLERARSLRKHETMVYDDGSFINDPKYIRRLLESTTELKPREIDEVIINLRGYVPTPERLRDAIAEADTTLRRAEAEFIENIRTMDKEQLTAYIDSLTPSDVIYEGATAVKDAIGKRASDEDIASAFNRTAPEGDGRDYIAMRAMFMENLATMSRKNFKSWLDSQPKNSPFADALRAARDTMETGIARQDMEAVFRESSTRNRSTANEFYDTINSLSDAEITMMMDPRPAFTDQDIADIVNQEILYRTFQDDSVIARVFTGIKRTGNEIGTKEFGLGDFVMKFTKVPGNIMTRKLEYSPWGYFKFFYTVAKVMYDNKKAHRPMSPTQQRSIALTLARPTTSLGCMAAGAWLRHVGIIVGTSTEYDQEYEEKQWNKAKNLGDFMINLSALKRFLDGESTDAQDGDDLLDIGWLEPVNSGFTFGASLYDQVGAGFIEAMGADGNEGEWEESAKEGKSKANEAFEYGKEHFSEIITGMINPVIGLFEDISAVRGIKQLVYNWEDAGGRPDIFAAITLSDWAQSFIPAMAKRVGYVRDTVTRNPYKEEDWLAALEASWKSSLPFMSLREQVPESVDVFGDTKSSTLGNVWMDILNEFIMPGRISKYKKTEITDEIDRLSQYSTDVIPKTPFQKNNRVTIDGQQYSFELSGKSYEEYSKLYGQMQYDWIKDIIGNEYYKYMSDNEKVELLSQAVKDAQTTMKEYWVYKKHGASQETLDSVVADAKSELVSEPAMTMKKKQAIRWVQQDGVKVEDYTDAYLQVPVNQIPEEMEKQINNAEKAIARTKAGKQYKEVNGKRVYSRDWTQQERDDKIAQEQAEIENIKNGTKKKNVDITGEWKDLTPEQQEKLEWYIDKYIDEIELPEEAISVMIDDSTKPYEEADEITDLDEEELGTLAYEPEDDDNTYTLAQAGGRYESSGSSSRSSGSSGRRSSGRRSGGSRRSSGRSYSRSGRSSGGYSRSGGYSGGRWSGFGGGYSGGGGGSGGGTMLASARRIPGEKRSAGDINPIIDRLFANMRPRLNDPRIPYDELITQPYDPRPSLTPYFYA